MKSGHGIVAGLFLFLFEILGLTAKNDAPGSWPRMTGERRRGIIW